MAYIRNMQQLTTKMNAVSRNVLNSILDNMFITLQSYIDLYVYQAYEPIEYERTFEFLQAWKIKKARIIHSVITGAVSFDPSKLVTRDAIHHGAFNQLAELIYEGYPIYGNPENVMDARDYWTPFLDDVQLHLRQWIIAAFKQYGLNVY